MLLSSRNHRKLPFFKVSAVHAKTSQLDIKTGPTQKTFPKCAVDTGSSQCFVEPLFLSSRECHRLHIRPSQ